MGKRLEEMTLSELWELFPIFLVAHDDRWEDYYREMEEKIGNVLGDTVIHRISHIGSTAIDGIWSKNIVDVLLELESDADMESAACMLKEAGLTVMSESKNRISMNQGYTENGFLDKVYHVHLRYAGDNDELYFRDYMNEYPDEAAAYESLKMTLWKKYEHDRDAYTRQKTGFIREKTEAARKKYGHKYE